MLENKNHWLSKTMLLLVFGHLVTDLSQGALPVLLPFLKDNFNLTYAQIGFIVLTQNLTSSVIQPLFGYFSDKISVSWLLPVSILLSGIGMAAMGLAPSYFWLLVSVIFGGLGIAGFHPQASKCAHFVSTSTTRGRNMGMFSVGGNAGFAVGSIFMSFLLGLPGVTGNTVYFFVPAALMALLILFNLKLVTPEMPQPVQQKQNTKISSRPPLPIALLTLLLLFIFVRSSIHTGLMTYIPLYYVNYLSGSPMYGSYLLSAFLLSGVVGTFMGGLLSDKFGRKPVIIFSMLFSLPLICLLQYTTGFATLVLLSLIGMTLISSFATTMVFAQEMMPGYEGMASGLTVGFSVGMGGLGATILGYIADHFGVPSVFTALSIAPLIGLIIVLFFPSKAKSTVSINQ